MVHKMNAFPFSQNCKLFFLAFSNWQSPWGAPFIESGWNWYHAGTVDFWVLFLILSANMSDVPGQRQCFTYSCDFSCSHCLCQDLVLSLESVWFEFFMLQGSFNWFFVWVYKIRFQISRARWLSALVFTACSKYLFLSRSSWQRFVRVRRLTFCLLLNSYSFVKSEFKLILVGLSPIDKSICMMRLNLENGFFSCGPGHFSSCHLDLCDMHSRCLCCSSLRQRW